jgi:hypothetical protein
MEKTDELKKEMGGNRFTDDLVWYQNKGDVEPAGSTKVEARMEDIALTALHVDDDPTLNPWTFRMWFLGMYLQRSRLLYVNI